MQHLQEPVPLRYALPELFPAECVICMSGWVSLLTGVVRLRQVVSTDGSSRAIRRHVRSVEIHSIMVDSIMVETSGCKFWLGANESWRKEKGGVTRVSRSLRTGKAGDSNLS